MLPNGFAIAEERPGQTAAHHRNAWRITIILPAKGSTLLQVDSGGLEESRHYQRNVNLCQPCVAWLKRTSSFHARHPNDILAMPADSTPGSCDTRAVSSW